MTSHSHLSVAIVTLTVLGIGTTRAQVQSQDAVLVRVEGTVSLNGQPIAPSDAAILGDPAVIQTSEGRAVIALKRGGLLAVDGHTRARVRPNGIDNSNAIEIVEGTSVVLSGTSASAGDLSQRSQIVSERRLQVRFCSWHRTRQCDMPLARLRRRRVDSTCQRHVSVAARPDHDTRSEVRRHGPDKDIRKGATGRLRSMESFAGRRAALSPRSTAGTKLRVASRGPLFPTDPLLRPLMRHRQSGRSILITITWF